MIIKSLESWKDTPPFTKIFIITAALWLIVNGLAFIGIL
jgi:hypothetical protein